MEIAETPSPVLLSDYEVYAHLSASQQQSQGKRRRVPQSVMTIEFEVLEYLRPSCSGLDLQKMDFILAGLSKWRLSKTERLQLVNLLPGSAVEFHTVVEECEERFGPEDVDAILAILNKHK